LISFLIFHTVVEAQNNKPPVADAGKDQTVRDSDSNGEVVRLDGSGSSDSDGSIVSYVWTEGEKQLATGEKPTVTLPVDEHTIKLTVTDDKGATGTDQVKVTVNANLPPVANAGDPQSVTVSDGDCEKSMTLDGSKSFDPDGTIVNYVWSENGTQLATGEKSSVTLDVGEHTIELKVTDNDNAMDTDQVVITVINEAPVAKAGPPQTVTVSNGKCDKEVMLDGSTSFDPSNGAIEEYVWTKNGTVLSREVTFKITLPVGEHTIELKVTDNCGATDTDEVVITVKNEQPEAKAGPDTVVVIDSDRKSESVTLDGSRSSDPSNGTIES